MAVVKILAFGGMIPVTDDRLLPDMNAAFSQNCFLYTGQLVGITTPKYIRDLTDPTAGKAYRIPNNYFDAEHIEDAYWMEFVSIDTDVIRSPIVDDQYDRYYWASPLTVPQVNSLARIKAGQPSYNLGIIAPYAGPIISSIIGGSGITETRAYLTTWVTAFGEESAPSIPVLGTGRNDATWNLTLPTALAPDVTAYNIAKTRIYRTIASGGSTEYFFVAEIPVATTTFADNVSSTTVSANEVNISTTWTPPPNDLLGLITMPNGMIAGWRGSELWFCEPFRPHAWPAAYSTSVEYPIVGLGVINQTLVVCTAGYPMVATGIHPDSISMSKLASFEPCLSRGSILSVPEGVLYASPNGLVLVANGQASLITDNLIQKDEWNSYNKIATLRATRMSNAYYAFGSVRKGFVQTDAFQTNAWQQDDFFGSVRGILLDPTNPRISFNLLSSVDLTVNVFNDAWSGETLIIRNGKIYRLDMADREFLRETALWRSKIFQSNDKKNFAALRVYFEIPPWATEAYKDRLPAMTGPVTSGVTMSANSEYPGYEAWKAGSDVTSQMWSNAQFHAYPQILTIDFGLFAKFAASQYAFMGADPADPTFGYTYAPKSWTFQGSNDGSTWTTLDTRTGETGWATGEVRTYNIPKQVVVYQYYRFNFLENNGGADNFITVGMMHIAPTSYGSVRVYADDRLVMQRELRVSSELMRLPSGFKADYWQIEFETNVRVNSVQMGTSVKELLKA